MLAKSQKSDIVNIVVHWSLRDYVEGADSPIEDWYLNDLSIAGKLAFDALLKNTVKTENHLEWSGFKYPHGELRRERIWQVVFGADGRQYRVLGVFGSLRKQAVLLVGCYHKGKVYTPPNAFDTAIKRAKTLREGKAGTRERKIKFNI